MPARAAPASITPLNARQNAARRSRSTGPEMSAASPGLLHPSLADLLGIELVLRRHGVLERPVHDQNGRDPCAHEICKEQRQKHDEAQRGRGIFFDVVADTGSEDGAENYESD